MRYRMIKFFYKLYLNGGNILFTPDIQYVHFDAKSGNIKIDKLYRDHYTVQRNYTIFWYRFLFIKTNDIVEKVLLCLCLLYRMFAQTVFFVVKCIVRRRFDFILKWNEGYKTAFLFIKNNK